MRSTVAARLVRPFLALGEKSLAGFDLSGIDFDDPEARVDYHLLLQLIELAERLTGQRMGLGGAALDVGTLQLFEYMSRSSLSALDALTRCARYQRILHESCDLRLVPGEHTTEVVLGIKHGLPLPASIAEFFMGSLFQALSRLGVPGAVAVHFAHAAPPALTQHEAFFRAPLCFDAPRHYAVFDTAALSQPLASADAALAKTLERHAAEMLERIPRGSAFADRLRQLLIELLPGGAPSLRACAQRLRMSERTVRRRLADDGHNYQSLLDELRHNLALHYLSIDDFDAERAAFLLGFTDASSFRRAFKRWTGRTLVVHRTQLAERAR